MENSKKVRSKKLDPRVDLTAMVSVSFLLIIFFMVTTELSKQKIMSLSLPEKDISCGGFGCSSGSELRIQTVLLDENDKIITYSGLLECPLEAPKKVKYGKDGIRKELQNKQIKTLKYYADMGLPHRGSIIIIKPSEKSNFKNLVDILDEMAIVNIDTYSIVNEFTPEESKLLAKN
ncbi:biopolymer transporter ExbD [Flavobacterium sp. 5]|uniref:ExbD/TolR family protein n=1 Tax=Flavobacterium sp. 5 TaxID=2035199 RepID=UPI000C2BC59F|nr:biopolymer transporter ExbD [Flavobacterium sp. 5]PKB18682.1 biopolymer transport protein ExbD [Flavobacterium sp. 5]